MIQHILTFCGAFALATAAFAHGGVKDPQVMARMNLMTAVANDMKTLGAMAKGRFDPSLAKLHGEKLATHASDIEALFEPPARDPKSEARPEIWTDWQEFLQIAADMEAAARSVATSQDAAAFKSAFSALGKTCASCHEDYRINKD